MALIRLDGQFSAGGNSKGDTEAQFQASTYFHSISDIDSCVRWLRVASEMGHVKATTNLGICYFFGDGVEQSYETALGLLEKSAAKGDVNCDYYLGLSLLEGLGRKRNPESGFQILLSSAKSDMPLAQLAVADCYRDGNGVEADLFEAVSWYARSAKHGLDRATTNFNEIYYSTNFTDENGSQRFFWFELDAMTPE